MKNFLTAEDLIVSLKFFKRIKIWKKLLYNNIFLLNSHLQSEAETAAEDFLMGIVLIKTLEKDFAVFSSEQNLAEEFKYRLVSINRIFHINLFNEILNKNVIIDEDILSQVLSECEETNIREELNGILPEAFGVIYEYLRYSQSGDSSKTKRKTRGVYYTPAYIVDHIIENTIGQKFYEKPGEISQIRIYDPSCGSGIFLLRAYDYIINYLSRSGTVSLEKKKEVLKRNIFGTDIDSNAVEITKLSLCMKLLGNDKIIDLPDLSKNFDSINFLFDKTPLFDHFNGKFDVIIGNPPYNAGLKENERALVKKNFNLGTTDTAAVFMTIADEKLKSGGINGFIIPKPFVYSSNWARIRKKFLPGILELIDCGIVWDQVKLEQVIYLYEKDRNTKTYLSGIRTGREFSLTGEFDKQLYNDFGLLLNGISEAELKVGIKIKDSGLFLNDIVDNHRGAPLQKGILDEKSDFMVIGGKQISYCTINSNVKGYFPLEELNDSRAIIKDNSVLVQNIVAHVNKPGPAIKITAALSNSFNYKNYLVLDTVNQLHNKGIYTAEFICAVLNSKLLSWYVYNFIFGRAIRTMHFDNYVTKRIPVPQLDLDDPVQKKHYERLNKLVKKFVENRHPAGQKSFAKKLLERYSAGGEENIPDEIETIINTLYGLNQEECRIIKIL
ncbi:MAG: N-6 DNA methylase [Ignavibacteriaceae bacterium]